MAMSKQRLMPLDLFTDETLMELPLALRWTAIALRMNADDSGRESANARLVKAATWPLDESMTVEVIEDHLLELDALGVIGIYNVGARTYYAMAVWPAVSHPVPSILPVPPLAVRQRFASGPLASRSAGEREGERESAGEREGEGASESAGSEGPAGVPPSPFCKLHQPSGTRSNCRHCGTARLAQEQWIHEHTNGTPMRPAATFTDPESDPLPY